MPEKLDSNDKIQGDQSQAVLVAVDFSDDSRAALIWACQFANCVGAPLVVLHVIHDPATMPGFYRSEGQDELRPMQAVAQSMMDEFLEEMKTIHPAGDVLKTATTRLVAGLPPGRIIEVAELLGAQLIVLGSRGLTGLPHLMLGSVAERVVELAPQPVVVVKAPDRESRKKNKKKKNKNKKNRKRLKGQTESARD
jgi:nucleotide-binding universal stress UspA family protein